MTCCTICLPWVLLTSYAVLLLAGLSGGFFGFTNFGYVEPMPPTPPPTPVTTTTTTTTPDPYGNRNYYRRDVEKVPQDYKDYAYASREFAQATSDERFYVIVPCVVTVIVAALVMLRGLCSRTFFNYTFTLYSTLGLWILTMAWIVMYQTQVGWKSDLSLRSAVIVMGIQSVLIVLLSVQVLLCVAVLRLNKADWPTLNWRNLFTAEAILIVARITLTVFTISALFSSQLVDGFSGPRANRYREFYMELGIRFPLPATLLCVCAACYNAIAIIENTLSMLFGKMNNCMTTLTTLLSALCNTSVAIVASPVVIRSLISHTSYIHLQTLYFSIGLSVVTFLHLVSCIGFPTSSRTPPQVLYKLCDTLISAVKSIRRDHFWYPAPSHQMKSQKAILIINSVSSVYSVFSIIIVLAVWDSPLYRAWGSALLLCANSATLVRTLPPIITELKFKVPDNTPANQRVIAMALECVALLVGGISACARTYHPGEIFGGVANLLFLCFQLFLMVQFVKGKIGATVNEDTVCFSDTEEELLSQNKEDEEEQKELNNGDILA